MPKLFPKELKLLQSVGEIIRNHRLYYGLKRVRIDVTSFSDIEHGKKMMPPIRNLQKTAFINSLLSTTRRPKLPFSLLKYGQIISHIIFPLYPLSQPLMT